MDEVLIQAALSMPDGMMQEAVNKLIAGLLGGAVAWYARKWYLEKESRGERIDKLYNTVFGMDDVHTMEGVVEVLETHEEDIESIQDKLNEYHQRQKEIERKVETLTDRVRIRKEDEDKP